MDGLRLNHLFYRLFQTTNNMKELLQEFKDNEVKSEVHAEQQQKKEFKLMNSQRRIPGLTLFEFNIGTKKLVKAQFKTDETLELKSLSLSPEELQEHAKVIINDNCAYFQALNDRSARKRMVRQYGVVN